MTLTIGRGSGAGDFAVGADGKVQVKAGSEITIEGTGAITSRARAASAWRPPGA